MKKILLIFLPLIFLSSCVDFDSSSLSSVTTSASKTTTSFDSSSNSSISLNFDLDEIPNDETSFGGLV